MTLVQAGQDLELSLDSLARVLAGERVRARRRSGRRQVDRARGDRRRARRGRRPGRARARRGRRPPVRVLPGVDPIARPEGRPLARARGARPGPSCRGPQPRAGRHRLPDRGAGALPAPAHPTAPLPAPAHARRSGQPGHLLDARARVPQRRPPGGARVRAAGSANAARTSTSPARSPGPTRSSSW